MRLRSRFALGCFALALWLPAVHRPPVLGQAPSPEPPPPAARKSAQASHGRRTNRLAKETSPYLLLHAHNPVDWHPWGEEALAKARAENKLIFLSIGYSSCYWCHVMERESFADDDVAALLNKHFVSIKVDREERPDIDEIYMTALEVLGRPGGWPLTMFLTPEGKPFFGGTYFPPRDKQIEPPGGGGARQQMPGLVTLLGLVHDAWKQSPEEVRVRGDAVAAAVKRALRHRLVSAQPPDERLAEEVQAGLADQYDERYGGFGYSAVDDRRPKFPEPANLAFLVDRVRRTGDEQARQMLVGTLDKMAAGGIRDHVGGGFHRYSTDRFWRIPHFEKMLYDNAQLAAIFAEAHQLTGRADFREVVEETLDFVLRELTDPAGGFYSALDAETDAEEGRYYVWLRSELDQALGKDDFELLASAYGVAGGPNFEGRSVLLVSPPLEETAARRGLSVAELSRRLAPIRRKLLAVRAQRNRPLTDTKILTGWNGLMIRGFADAGRLLGKDDYLQVARRAADFVLDNLRTPQGRLLHTYTSGQAKLNAYLDDYAFFVDGLIALHLATGERRWLQEAGALTSLQVELFWDDDLGGFFFTSSDHEELIARSKDPVDSVLPSGGAVAAGNLVYLAQALDKPAYLDRARRTILAAGDLLARAPAAMPRMAMAWAAFLEAGGTAESPPQGQ